MSLRFLARLPTAALVLLSACAAEDQPANPPPPPPPRPAVTAAAPQEPAAPPADPVPAEPPADPAPAEAPARQLDSADSVPASDVRPPKPKGKLQTLRLRAVGKRCVKGRRCTSPPCCRPCRGSNWVATPARTLRSKLEWTGKPLPECSWSHGGECRCPFELEVKGRRNGARFVVQSFKRVTPPPRVLPSPPAVPKGEVFDVSLVERTFRMRRRVLSVCWRREQRRQPDLAEDTVTVDLTIVPRGTVSGTSVASKQNLVEVASCVNKVVKRFRFNPGPQDTVRYRAEIALGEKAELRSIREL